MTLSNRAINWLTERGLDIEVCDRLGLTSGRRGAGETIIVPTYRQDRIVARKLRLLDDTEQKWSAESGGETCFWNENVLRDRSLDTEPLIITEGHWDAIAALQCGFVRTVSVPNGAPQRRRDGETSHAGDKYRFVQAMMAELTKERFREIVIASDDDGPGHQLLHDLSIQLGRYRCKFVTYGDGAKDLNDVLLRDGPAGVVRSITGAKFIALPGVFLMSELPPLPPETIYEIGSEDRGMRLMGESYRMRLGDFAIITGMPGFGKTAFVNDIVCRVVDHYGLKAAWASFEQSPQRDMRRVMDRWYNSRESELDLRADDASEWIDAHHVVIAPTDDDEATLDWLLDAMEGAVVRHGCKIVVADPWNEIEHCRAPGETETEYVGRAIRTLKRFARKFQVHVILVAHPAKLQRENGKYAMPSLYDISGSANFYNKADVGLVVHRSSPTETIIRIQKVRYHGLIGKPGDIAVTFSGRTARFTETERLA